MFGIRVLSRNPARSLSWRNASPGRRHWRVIGRGPAGLSEQEKIRDCFNIAISFCEFGRSFAEFK